LPGWKRSTLEQRMRAGCVQVNGVVVRRNELLAAGDAVRVDDIPSEPDPRPPPAGIAILHEDDELVAIDKPAGLLAVSTEDERERTALALLRAHLSGPKGRALRLWPVHRIDRETSGVLLFAKSAEARERLQDSWGSARKTYLALVEGRPQPAQGAIHEPLWEDETLLVRVGRGAGAPNAKDARTRYRTLASDGKRTLLEVELDTGRRQQIRAHLAHVGHPVVGDARRGSKGARLFLHALRLCVPRADGGELVLEAPVPRGFRIG
jgi:23S rRNA pseudouridine1911/1915/1917 synthase